MNRRDWLRLCGFGFGAGVCRWLPVLADELPRRRHCVLLWMNGGASQTDTFDMKPGHRNGGEFREIATSVPGLRFSEHLPQLATQAEHLAVVRGLSTKEGDHGRGTYLMRTGHPPMGPVRFPGIGSSLSKELGRDDDSIPSNVSISPYRAFNQAAYGPGFLGPRFAPLTVGASDVLQATQAAPDPNRYAELKVDDLTLSPGVDETQFNSRLELWRSLQDGFLASRRGGSAVAQHTVYERAIRLMNSDAASAFDLTREPASVRDAYGRGRFGQGCLMARRLLERGVAFVEVSLGTLAGGAIGWDTHQNNFPAVKALSAELDAGWATLLRELKERELLESTTILWLSEFGRTPQINAQAGRDHFPRAWTCVFAGDGVRGGQAFGRTTPDGTEVAEGKVDVGDVLATLCQSLGVSPQKQNMSEIGRPIRIAEGTPIKEIVA